MRRLVLSLTTASLLAASAMAQDETAPLQLEVRNLPEVAAEVKAPVAPEVAPVVTPVLTPAVQKPYYQESRAIAPAVADEIHAAAAERARQRNLRISARKWYGFSNARPTVTASPFTAGSYSPSWVGGGMNSFDFPAFGWSHTTTQEAAKRPIVELR